MNDDRIVFFFSFFLVKTQLNNVSAPLEALRFSDVSVRLNCSLSVLVISSMQPLSLLNDRVNPDILSELRLRSLFCALCSFFVLPHGYWNCCGMSCCICNSVNMQQLV